MFHKLHVCSRHARKLKELIALKFSSVIGKVGAVGQTNYAASKAGVIGFTKATAKELARFDIRCNCICPGYIEVSNTYMNYHRNVSC